MKKIPYGISDYEKLITNDYYYVDKTMYLEKLEDIGDTLIYLRPRRFGKTLFTSMMYYYYDINSIDKFDTLFKDTYVYNNPTKDKNNYYILKFDFSGMNSAETIEEIKEKFNMCVKQSIISFMKYYNLELNIDFNIDASDLLKSFLVNVELDNKIYIIIDEYDNFTNSILSSNTNIFKKILGTNGFVKDFYARIKEYRGTIIDRVFITGVCSISLDSMTSGFNVGINITNDYRFNAMTALTHDEVKTLIKDLDNKEEIFNEMLEYYDGYKFNRIGENVFNPTLTMYFVKNIIETGEKPEVMLDSNIISNYEQIRNIISLGNYKEIIDDIYDNGEVDSILTVNFDLNKQFKREDIVSLLYYFGYLTIKRTGYIGTVFTIPNNVIKEVFNNYFMEILEKEKVEINNNEANMGLIEMAETGRIDKITEVISSILKQDSFRDFINITENVIKQMYLTLLNRNNAFDMISEMEVKNGYVDIYFRNKNNLSIYNIMIELKYLKKTEESQYNQKYNEALEQINKYIEDDRINKINLKKYIVIFTGSDYKITEIE